MNKLIVRKLNDESVIKIIIEENKTELYDIIYQRYIQKVTDKCYSLLKNKQLADEFANDILIKTFEKLIIPIGILKMNFLKLLTNHILKFRNSRMKICSIFLIKYTRKKKHCCL
jgi:DNA-directed RNA polymerase specialized sigma24 family protein